MHKKPGCFPTAQQELLLRASLLEGPDALEAWREWSREGNLDELDEGSYRLLPLLCKSLKKLSVTDPCMSKLEDAYRLAFRDNQLLFCKTLGALRELKKAGIELMLLKGAALAVLNYKKIALRPMIDLDVLVPTEKAGEAIELLSGLGWKPLLKAPHSQAFQSSDGGELDLHWHALLELSEKDSDSEFWDGAIRFDIQDVQLLASNATDTLFQVCIHGLKWNPLPPLRWIADATMILQCENQIDWDRLVRLAKKHRLTLSLRESLQYLKDLLNAPIPASVLTQLDQVPVAASERFDYECTTCPHSERGPFLTLWAYYREYMHWAKSHGIKNRFTGFAIFLKHLWGAKNVWHVPFLAAEGLARRSFKRLKKQLP